MVNTITTVVQTVLVTKVAEWASVLSRCAPRVSVITFSSCIILDSARSFPSTALSASELVDSQVVILVLSLLLFVLVAYST